MIKTRRQLLFSSAIISALALGSCGIKGDLQTPPPLWGEKAKKVEPKQSEPSKTESNN